LERSAELAGLTKDKLPPEWAEQLKDAAELDALVRQAGFELSPEVAALSLLQGVPFDPQSINIAG